jgi:thiamine-phosphate pyrophosphorylase
MTPLPPGLYGIADSAFGDPVELSQRLSDAGCKIIQLRAKDCTHPEVLGMAIRIRQLLPKTLLIINDHIDIAAKSGADGVHLGQTDGNVADARAQLGSNAIVGLSTHTMNQVLDTTGASYIGFGPVFTTTTKRNPDQTVGTESLRKAVLASELPVIAIGGIDKTNIHQVRATGAHGWAVIRGLFAEPNLIDAVSQFGVEP